MLIDPKTWATARKALDKLATSRSTGDALADELGSAAIESLITLFHEELHGVAPGTRWSTHGCTAKLEDALVEVLARRQVRLLMGYTETPESGPLGLPTIVNGKWEHTDRAYDRYVRHLLRSLANVTHWPDPKKVVQALERGVFSFVLAQHDFERGSPGRFRAEFVDALGLLTRHRELMLESLTNGNWES